MLSFVMRSDWRYLLRHTADGRTQGDDTERSRDDQERPRDYYTPGVEHGEPPGRWWGRGAESLGLEGEVTEAVMEKLYGAMVDPATGEALGSRPRTYATYEDRLASLLDKEPDATPERVAEIELEAHKSHREARTYADLTFSPPKSWSVLHAALEHAGRHDEAAALWDSWEVGVHAGLQYLMDEVGYSRAGYHGAKIAGRTSGKWVDAHDFVISLWRHHTSRDGDPQLHIHAAVLNRVLCEDGVWRSLDSNAISAARVAAGAISERAAEEDATRSLGLRFALRPDGKAREIVGIDKADRDLFSSRRRAITAGVAELAAAYEAKHGKAPSAYVLTLMAQHVTLKTRARKPDQSPSREELLARWEQAIQREQGRSLDDVLKAVDINPKRVLGAETFQPERVIAQAIADVETTRAVWTRHDLIAGIIRHLPDELAGLSASQVRTLADDLADRALTTASARGVVTLTVSELIPVPEELRRSDGRSQFEPHRPDRFATAGQLAREESLLATARQTGAPKVSEGRIDRLLRGTTLAGDQRAAVAEILGSGKRLEVLVGPPGTGKSFTVGTLVELWGKAFGADVFGLAVAENAVNVLRDEGIQRGANVHKFLAWHDDPKNAQAAAQRVRHAHDALSAAERSHRNVRAAEDRLATALAVQEAMAIRKGQLVVIDEASTISTVDLTRVVQIAKDAGAKILVTGDPQQLGAVDVGGAMRLLVDQVGALELAEVRRFAQQWEREASLRIRDADPGALIEYNRRGRLVGGSREEMCRAALDGFLGDYLNGKRSLLIVDDNDRAAEFCSKLRQTLVDVGIVEAPGVELHNETLAGAGDLIQTRRNDYKVRVVNREVWQVKARTPGGGLTVRHDLGRDEHGEQRWGVTRHLPADYVREHVELAYASTVHAAEGRNVDTGHQVVDERTGLPAFLVGATRGIESNVAYVVTEGAEHLLARLSDVLQRPDPERAALHVQREEFDSVGHLQRLGPIWTSRIAAEADERYRSVLIAELGQERGERTAEDPASGALYRLLRTAELAGQDVPAIVAAAVASRELDSAESVAQVLFHRLEARLAAEQQEHRREDFAPRSYVDRTPQTTTQPEPVSAYVRAVAQAMDDRAAYLAELAAAAPPAWAERLGPVPDEPLARVEWTERAAAVAAYREHFGHDSEVEAIGPAPRAADPDRRVAWEQAADALGIRDAEREMARRTEGELLNLIDAYRREEAWMPANVDDRLRTAHIAARESEASAARLRAELVMVYDNARERIDVAQRLSSAEALAARMRDRAATLDEIAEVRAAAVASVADVETAARAARAELRHRGIDPETLRRGDAEHEPGASGGRPLDPERVPVRGDEREIDQDLAEVRGSDTERRMDRPAPDREAVTVEATREEIEVGADLDESARLAEDLAKAREAADRLVERHEVQIERAADLEVRQQRSPQHDQGIEIGGP